MVVVDKKRKMKIDFDDFSSFSYLSFSSHLNSQKMVGDKEEWMMNHSILI